jgi:hypothetical protein
VALDTLDTARGRYGAARAGEAVRYTLHAATFLAADGPWAEWAEGTPDGELTEVDALRALAEGGE